MEVFGVVIPSLSFLNIKYCDISWLFPVSHLRSSDFKAFILETSKSFKHLWSPTKSSFSIFLCKTPIIESIFPKEVKFHYVMVLLSNFSFKCREWFPKFSHSFSTKGLKVGCKNQALMHLNGLRPQFSSCSRLMSNGLRSKTGIGKHVTCIFGNLVN